MPEGEVVSMLKYDSIKSLVRRLHYKAARNPRDISYTNLLGSLVGSFYPVPDRWIRVMIREGVK
jgi:hypothetical protein